MKRTIRYEALDPYYNDATITFIAESEDKLDEMQQAHEDYIGRHHPNGMRGLYKAIELPNGQGSITFVSPQKEKRAYHYWVERHNSVPFEYRKQMPDLFVRWQETHHLIEMQKGVLAKLREREKYLRKEFVRWYNEQTGEVGYD